MAHQYVFQMYRLSKVYPPDKTVLSDITLAFLPGAKIGVLGEQRFHRVPERSLVGRKTGAIVTSSPARTRHSHVRL